LELDLLEHYLLKRAVCCFQRDAVAPRLHFETAIVLECSDANVIVAHADVLAPARTAGAAADVAAAVVAAAVVAAVVVAAAVVAAAVVAAAVVAAVVVAAAVVAAAVVAAAVVAAAVVAAADVAAAVVAAAVVAAAVVAAAVVTAADLAVAALDDANYVKAATLAGHIGCDAAHVELRSCFEYHCHDTEEQVSEKISIRAQ
jgi:hypothetical protein